MRRFWISDFGFGIGRGEMREVPGGSALSTFHLLPFTSARPSRRAFTLIELMGVMAIIGILAAVTLPSMISKIESARTENEDANLQEIARALAEGIKKRGQFPNPTLANGTSGSWTDIAQNYTSLGANALANALPNNNAPDNNPRRILFSDDLTTYLGGTYTQPATGRPVPAVGASLIIYILSSSKNGVPLSTGVIPPAVIANWTKAFDATLGYIPAPTSVFGAGNERRGEFLHVKALDVRSLLCRVDLTDAAAPETIAAFTVTTPGTGYPPSSTVNVSFGNNTLAFGTTPGDTYVDVPPPPANGIYNIGEGFSDNLVLNGIYDFGEFFTDGTSNGIYDASDILNDNNGDGIYSLSGGILTTTVPTLSKSADYNTRRVIPLVVAIPPGTASFTAPASPAAPTYDLISTAAGSGAFATQTISIYVIKGSSINLFNGAGVLDKSVVIQSDVQYKYFNSSWTRVD